MKTTIILLLFPILLHAQDTTRHKHKLLQTVILTTSVIANGLGDGLNSREYYAQGHALNALAVGGLLVYPFVGKIDWKTPVTYILIRYALFDLMYNIGAHRDWNYRGGANYYNQGIGHVPLSVLNGTKIISFGFAIYLNRR